MTSGPWSSSKFHMARRWTDAALGIPLTGRSQVNTGCWERGGRGPLGTWGPSEKLQQDTWAPLQFYHIPQARTQRSPSLGTPLGTARLAEPQEGLFTPARGPSMGSLEKQKTSRKICTQPKPLN